MGQRHNQSGSAHLTRVQEQSDMYAPESSWNSGYSGEAW